jgi:hypothetical protein
VGTEKYGWKASHPSSIHLSRFVGKVSGRANKVEKAGDNPLQW